jgi:hypothetical protein
VTFNKVRLFRSPNRWWLHKRETGMSVNIEQCCRFESQVNDSMTAALGHQETISGRGSHVPFTPEADIGIARQGSNDDRIARTAAARSRRPWMPPTTLPTIDFLRRIWA